MPDFRFRAVTSGGKIVRGTLAAAHEQQLAAAQAQIDAAGRVSEALGKAIALLHAHSESADSTTGD